MVQTMRIAAVIPSRGLVHDLTINAVEDNRGAVDNFRLRCIHARPIPDCDNEAAEWGLATGADAIWFVEEDVIPPSGALAALLAVDADIAAIDYPVGAPSDGWGCMVRDRTTGEIEWCGLGCTLIRRSVFERLPRPWFRSDIAYIRQGSEWEPRPETAAPDAIYGRQDIHFCMEARKAGIRIEAVPDLIALHAHLDSMGREGSNVGYHTISIRDRIERQWPGGN